MSLEETMKSLNLKLLCRHPTHNYSQGCGNPECWKYQEDAYEELGGEEVLICTREQFERLEDPSLRADPVSEPDREP
jgi:hypothetical protein